MSSKFILLLSLLTVLLFIQLSYSANIFSKAKLHSKCKKVKPTKKLDMDFVRYSITLMNGNILI